MRVLNTNTIKKLLITTCLILLFSGCSRLFDRTKLASFSENLIGSEKLAPRHMRKAIFTGTPTGDDPYSVGFQDGCKTYAGIIGSGSFRMMPIVFKPERLTGDPWYLRGYQDAAMFCTHRLDWDTH